MIDILDNFDFENADGDVLSQMAASVTDFLKKAEEHYAKIASDLSFKSASSLPPPSPPAAEKSFQSPQKSSSPRCENTSLTPISTLTESYHNVLDPHTLQQLKDELIGLNFHRTGNNRPEVCLFGENPYRYNKETKGLVPVPLMDSPIISTVLDIVKKYLGYDGLNSVLINKYRNKNTTLGWHKDDEKEIDQSCPVVSLSIGATRRFSISDSKFKSDRTHYFTKYLENNDIFVMKS